MYTLFGACLLEFVSHVYKLEIPLNTGRSEESASANQSEREGETEGDSGNKEDGGNSTHSYQIENNRHSWTLFKC